MLADFYDHSHDLIPAVLITPRGPPAANQYVSRGISQTIPPPRSGVVTSTLSRRGCGRRAVQIWAGDGAARSPQERTAGIKLEAMQAALLRQPSTHARAHPPLHRRMCMCCNPVCVFPLIVPILHPSPCHPLASLFCPFCQSHPPYFDLILLLRLLPGKKKKEINGKKWKKKKKPRTCVLPPVHAAGRALSLHKAAQFHAGLCKEMLKSVRYLCLMVSPWQLREQSPAMLCQPRRILNLSKEKSWIWSIKHFIL